jgi:integrase
MSIARRRIPGKPREEWPLVIRYSGRDGNRHEETIKSGLKKEAQRRLREIEYEKEKGIHVPKSQTENIAFLFKLWLDHYEMLINRGHGARSTLDAYKRDVKLHLLPEFGGTLITRFEALQGQHFVDKLMSRRPFRKDGSGKREATGQYSYSRLKAITIPLKLALDFAVDHKLVGRNVLKDRPIRLPEPPESTREWLEQEDAVKILRACEQRKAVGLHSDDNALLWRNQAVLIMLLMFTGIREAEACGLQWQNVDFSRRLLHVRHQMGRDGVITERLKSKKAKRSIPINEFLYEALVRHAPDVQDRVGTVLRNRWNQPMRLNVVISTIIPKVMTRAGLVKDDGSHKFTAHQLRHFAGSIWLAQGMPLDEVSRILGHTTIDFTRKTYIHQLEGDTRAAEAIERVGALFSGRPVTMLPAISTTADAPMIEYRPEAENGQTLPSMPVEIEAKPFDFTTKGMREMQRQRCFELWKANRSAREIAAEIGVTNVTVLDWIQQEFGNLKRVVQRTRRYEHATETPERREERNRKQREYYHARRQRARQNVSRDVTS